MDGNAITGLKVREAYLSREGCQFDPWIPSPTDYTVVIWSAGLNVDNCVSVTRVVSEYNMQISIPL